MLPTTHPSHTPWRVGLLAGLTSVVMSMTLTACTAPAAAPTLTPPILDITTTGTDTSVKVIATEQGAVLDITNPSGIGSAVVAAPAGATLPPLTLQLHLAGLEELRLKYGQTALIASVNSTTGQIATEALQNPDGSTRPLTATDAQWVTIRIVSSVPQFTLPLQAGYFEVTLPQDFLKAPPSTLEVYWIDFYR